MYHLYPTPSTESEKILTDLITVKETLQKLPELKEHQKKDKIHLECETFFLYIFDTKKFYFKVLNDY